MSDPKSTKTPEEELAILDSIVVKFADALLDAAKDLTDLSGMPPEEHANVEFRKALAAVKERIEDVTLSMKLILERRAALQSAKG